MIDHYKTHCSPYHFLFEEIIYFRKETKLSGMLCQVLHEIKDYRRFSIGFKADVCNEKKKKNQREVLYFFYISEQTCQ